MNMDLDAPFVIPNAVRNLAGKREEILRFALNDKRPNAEGHPPPLHRGECGSEAHEALTFWLLLGQAKSNGKSTLNDKCPERRGTSPPPPLQRGECGSEALGKKGDPLGGGLKA